MMRIESYVSAVQSLSHAAEALGLEIDIRPKGQPAAESRARRGGRPKGYKTSPATRAKLRAAWTRRKALALKTAKGRH